MFAQCPACQTIYKVNSADLAEMGLVHCGECGAIIQVTEVLRDSIPGMKLEKTDLPESEVYVPVKTPQITEEQSAKEKQQEVLNFDVEAIELDQYVDDAEIEPVEIQDNGFDELMDDPPLEPLEATPAFISPEVDHEESKPSTLLLLASITGIVVLVLGLMYSNRMYLSSIESLSSVVGMLCPTDNCAPLAVREVEHIRLINRDIRKHPSVEGALIISATMINDAGQPQPYPQLEIQLSNYQSQPVAMRRFAPAEYLKSSVNISNLMQPGVLVPVSFETVDPGDDAISFEFKFH